MSADTESPGRMSGVIRAVLKIPAMTMGLWIALALAAFMFLPQVDDVVSGQDNGTLPADAPTYQALEQMDESFGSGRAKSFVLVVFDAESGELTTADEAAYKALVERLDDNPEYVADVQDYLDDDNAREALTSDDGEATYLPVSLTAGIGTAAVVDQVDWVREQVAEAKDDTGASAGIYVSGDPANIIDSERHATETGDRTGLYSMVLLMIILLLIYRRVSSIVVPLATIGVAVGCTYGALSLAGELGMGLSTYTKNFCTAIVLGAGTDYSIFLISRFREEYARLGEVRPAVAAAVGRIGGALLASAGTVAASALVLHFASLSLFATTGPPIAVAVAVTVAVALTVTPALLIILGKRIGAAPPRTERNLWSRVGAYVATKPVRILLVGTAILAVMAVSVPTMTIAYSDGSADPEYSESAKGEEVLDEHFGEYATQPDYVLLVADHDMRNSRDLAVIAQASRDVAKYDTVKSVHSATQPGGEPIETARITNQLSKVSDELGDAARKIARREPELRELQTGTEDLASGADRQASGLAQATGSVPQLINALSQLADGTAQSAGGARKLSNAAAQLRDGTRDLANGLSDLRNGLSQSTNGIGQVLQGLNADPYCSQSPICSQSRSGLAQIYQNQRDKLVPGLSDAAAAANDLASGNADVSAGMRDLADGLDSTVSGQRDVNGGQRSLYSGLQDLSSGARRIADGLDDLPPGIGQLVDSTVQVSDGLGETSEYLGSVSEASDTAESGGFYLPASELTSNKELGAALGNFISSDGKVARIQIFGETAPGSTDGLDRFAAAKDAVQSAITGTTLDGSKVMATGAAGGTADLRDLYRADFKLVLIGVLAMVLLLMMIVLRAIIAPIYLLLSVILSYAAALGAGVFLFQHLLGDEIAFNVPVLAFVILVAVGADYNILLMSRMREARGSLTREKVGAAVTATGPVITSAGIIFASAFLPMVTQSLAALAQLCFVLVVGLLLDTFIVRTLIVPACAALVGDASWWPGRPDAPLDGDEGYSAPAKAAPMTPMPAGAGV